MLRVHKCCDKMLVTNTDMLWPKYRKYTDSLFRPKYSSETLGILELPYPESTLKGFLCRGKNLPQRTIISMALEIYRVFPISIWIGTRNGVLAVFWPQHTGICHQPFVTAFVDSYHVATGVQFGSGTNGSLCYSGVSLGWQALVACSAKS